MASSNVLVYGKASVDMASRSSSSRGSCRTFMGRFCRTSLTRGAGDISQALTQILHFVASRTASVPSVLFFGDRNKAYGSGSQRKPVEVTQGESKRWSITYCVTSLDTRIGQQDVPQIILPMIKSVLPQTSSKRQVLFANLRGPMYPTGWIESGLPT